MYGIITKKYIYKIFMLLILPAIVKFNFCRERSEVTFNFRPFIFNGIPMFLIRLYGDFSVRRRVGVKNNFQTDTDIQIPISQNRSNCRERSEVTFNFRPFIFNGIPMFLIRLTWDILQFLQEGGVGAGVGVKINSQTDTDIQIPISQNGSQLCQMYVFRIS